MSNAVIAGKPSNTIGDKDSQLILRGSSVKIQWGNKFIDLIKNGKINCENDEILQTVNSKEDITSDGIYLIKDQVWISINGTKVPVSNNSDTNYISFLIDQPDITSEQQNIALRNIGFYYSNIQEALNSGIKSGIIFNQEDNKLYVINEQGVIEYSQSISSKNTEEVLQKLYIENNQLLIDGVSYITCDDSKIIFNQKSQFQQGISSPNASDDYGFNLYMQDGNSYLQVDTLIERHPVNFELPESSIILYKKVGDNIPEGWIVCDGNNGTPDLGVVSTTVDYSIVYITKII